MRLYLSICLAYLFVVLSTLSVSSVYLFIYLACLTYPIYLPIYLLICLPICLSIVRLSAISYHQRSGDGHYEVDTFEQLTVLAPSLAGSKCTGC